jgi:hypothetical protein
MWRDTTIVVTDSLRGIRLNIISDRATTEASWMALHVMSEAMRWARAVVRVGLAASGAFIRR